MIGKTPATAKEFGTQLAHSRPLALGVHAGAVNQMFATSPMGIGSNDQSFHRCLPRATEIDPSAQTQTGDLQTAVEKVSQPSQTEFRAAVIRG